MRHLLIIALCGVAACGSGGGTAPDAAAGDAAVVVDAALDAGADAAVALPDSGARSDITAILGTLHAECPIIAGMLHSPSPSLVDDEVDFVAGEAYLRSELSPDGQRMYDIPNAGGSSIESEIMSFEILHYCDDASLLGTETEIHYAPPDDAGANTITDLEVSIGGEKVGVSVTRAYSPVVGGMTDTQVYDLLVKKLDGVRRSSERVLPADKWVKQILHVFVATPQAASQVHRMLPMVSAATRADTILLLTQTMGGGFIYCTSHPPLGMDCPTL